MVASGTQRKGDIAVTRAIATFTEFGWDVCVPVSESSRYDLVVDTGESLRKVQVKYTSTHEVGLRRVHSNSKGYAVRRYASQDFDWLYVLHEDGTEFLIQEDLSGRSSIRPRKEHLLGKEGAARLAGNTP